MYTGGLVITRYLSMFLINFSNLRLSRITVIGLGLTAILVLVPAAFDICVFVVVLILIIVLALVLVCAGGDRVLV